MAQTILVDLTEAGIPVVDSRGRVVDFHSLRHSFVTALGRSGCPLVVAQALARHSTPTLTANTYSDVDATDQSQYLDRLALPTGEPDGALDT